MRPEQNLDNFPEIFSPSAFRGLHLALIIEQMNLWNDSNHILYCGLRYHIVWWSNLTWNVRFRSIRVFLYVRVRCRSMTKLNETYSSDWVKRFSSKTECSIWFPGITVLVPASRDRFDWILSRIPPAKQSTSRFLSWYIVSPASVP